MKASGGGGGGGGGGHEIFLFLKAGNINFSDICWGGNSSFS